MSISLPKLIKNVDRSRLSTLNSVLTDILRIVHDPNANAWQLKQAIETDPALTARVLQRANSAYYGHPRQMREVFDAIICMGFDAIRELAVGQKVYELFRPGLKTFRFSALQLWIHSLAVATCSKLIYQRILRRHSEEIYTLGLLHDIGILVEAQFIPETFEAVLQKSCMMMVPLQQAEKDILGFTHAELAQSLGEMWDFPEDFCRIMRLDDQPLSAGWHTDKMAMTLLVANSACRNRGLGYNEFSGKTTDVCKDCMHHLKLTDCALNLIMDEVEESISSMLNGGWFSSLGDSDTAQAIA